MKFSRLISNIHIHQAIYTCILLAGQSSYAASGNWTGATDATWAGANWSATPVPGTGDTATFNAAAGAGGATIGLGAGVTVATLNFDLAAAAAYTIGSGAVGSQTLTLNDTGAITRTATVTNSELINANVVLGTAIAGTTTITNSSATGNLTIAGNLSGGTGGTAGVKTVNVVGATSSNTNLTGAITAGGASGINLSNNGTGSLTLSGSATSSVTTLRATANGAKTIVNGQNVTVSASSDYGRVSSSFELQSGSAAFNGGLVAGSLSGQITGADAQTFKISGGTFSASNVAMGRSQSFTGLQTNPTISSGFIVSGGTASITGTLNLSGNNSTVGGLVSGGSLTVAGETIIGNVNGTITPHNTRYNVFQVSGGTFTNTDTTNGLVISKGTQKGSQSEFLVTGGTSTVEKISFGVSASATTNLGSSLNNQGALVLGNSTSGGTLYIGSGGIVQGATANYDTTINLTNGTLGAKADWSSSLPMNLTGTTTVNIKAADAAGVAKNISLSGALSGTNGFTKTGDGTLTLSGTSTYTGSTAVSAGTLLVNGALGNTTTTVSSVATLGGDGTVGGNATVNGVLSVGVDTSNSTVGSLDFSGSTGLTLGLSGVYQAGIKGTATSDYDVVTVTNLFSVSGTIKPILSGYAPIAGNSFQIVNAGSYSGTPIFDYSSAVLSPGLTWDDSTFLTNGTISVIAVVPEPAAALLGGIGMLSILRRRRA